MPLPFLSVKWEFYSPLPESHKIAKPISDRKVGSWEGSKGLDGPGSPEVEVAIWT